MNQNITEINGEISKPDHLKMVGKPVMDVQYYQQIIENMTVTQCIFFFQLITYWFLCYIINRLGAYEKSTYDAK